MLTKPVCLICKKDIEGALVPPDSFNCWEKVRDIWNSPQGISFQSSGNYGSAKHDPMVENFHYELIICDECFESHKQHMQKVVYHKHTHTEYIDKADGEEIKDEKV